MKKLFVGFMGLLLVVASAKAANTIKAATVKQLNNEINVIQNGTRGVTPDTSSLATEEGTAVSDSTVNGVTVGYLAAAATAAPSGSNGYSGNPTSTIEANDANIKVLKRDKLSVAGNPSGAGHCNNGDECGYVTIGDQNNTTDKIWMRITKCTGSGNNVTCE